MCFEVIEPVDLVQQTPVAHHVVNRFGHYGTVAAAPLAVGLKTSFEHLVGMVTLGKNVLEAVQYAGIQGFMQFYGFDRRKIRLQN